MRYEDENVWLTQKMMAALYDVTVPANAGEREHILRALQRSSWHIKGPNGAAAALGLKPPTLYSRMKKLGIALRRES